MAQMGEDNSLRTYEPTELRIKQARRSGRVAISSDLTAGVVLVSAGIFLGFIMSGIVEDSSEILIDSMSGISKVDGNYSFSIGYAPFWNLFLLFSLLVICIAVGVSVLQTRGLWASEVLKFDSSRLSPANGIKRIFANSGWVKLLLGWLKVAAVILTGWIVLKSNQSEIRRLCEVEPDLMLEIAGDVLSETMLAVGLVLTAVGVVDLLLVRWRYHKSLMMTRREYLEDLKQMGGQAGQRTKIYRTKS